jgi:hypothetical protein
MQCRRGLCGIAVAVAADPFGSDTTWRANGSLLFLDFPPLAPALLPVLNHCLHALDPFPPSSCPMFRMTMSPDPCPLAPALLPTNLNPLPHPSTFFPGLKALARCPPPLSPSWDLISLYAALAPSPLHPGRSRCARVHACRCAALTSHPLTASPWTCWTAWPSSARSPTPWRRWCRYWPYARRWGGGMGWSSCEGAGAHGRLTRGGILGASA